MPLLYSHNFIHPSNPTDIKRSKYGQIAISPIFPEWKCIIYLYFNSCISNLKIFPLASWISQWLFPLTILIIYAGLFYVVSISFVAKGFIIKFNV